jgi:tetratricopeptide (TPR) repeat protein
VRVPFRLRHRPTPAPAAGLWLASADPRHLAGLCARLSGAWPEVYALADGLLIVTDEPPAAGLPRTVRLRRLAGHLYLPADADLVPALHPAEAVDLTGGRGLVFLPGRVLAFDPSRPLAVAEVVAPSAVRRGTWERFPPRPERADRLVAIRYEGPTRPEAILEQGRPGAGGVGGGVAGADEGSPGGESGASSLSPGHPEEEVRPASAPPLRRAAAGATLGFGKFLTWLGRTLRQQRLAKAGAEMMRRAVERVPRLTEKILGRQQASLRELLRRLQSGDIEGALPFAPAFHDGNGRPHVDDRSKLQRRDPRYSLSALLGGGPGTVWLGGGDVWADLAAEYRKIARAAADRGDYRRAAYIYGVLLRDLRTAADTLAAGGLHHDAAVLYRDRLNDPRAAAPAFERAGDFDEAVRLYRRTEQFERAGDLLRRLGDEDGAVEMYVAAADRLAKLSAHLAAGDLMRTRAGRIDLALAYYEVGWDAPPPMAVPCGLRLLDHYLGVGAGPELGQLLDEAAAKLGPPGKPADAGRFYAAVARAAGHVVSEEFGAELRDRARLALAAHLRFPASRSAPAVSDLFGGDGAWPAPVVRDASYAARQAPKPAKVVEVPRTDPLVRLVNGTVTAAVVARGSYDVVVGTASGEVAVWRAESGQVERVTIQGGAVDALATDAKGRVVVTLHRDGDDGRLRSYTVDQNHRFWYVAERDVPGTEDDPIHLLSVIRAYYGEYFVDVAGGADNGCEFRGVRLLPTTFAPFDKQLSDHDRLYLFGSIAVSPGSDAGRSVSVDLPWRPAVPEGSPLGAPPTDWLNPGRNAVEIVGLTAEGDLYWSWLGDKDGRGACETACRPVERHKGFRAAALAGSRKVVGLTADNGVVWLKVVGEAFETWVPAQWLPVPARAVAAFARPPHSDVVIVFEDGTATRVVIPTA